MFNRFDGVIKREVDAANTAAGLKGADALDPNLLKSMLFLWLFEKHKKGMSWPDTIRAYNGSGARADHYRDAVTALGGRRCRGGRQGRQRLHPGRHLMRSGATGTCLTALFGVACGAPQQHRPATNGARVAAS